MQIAHNETIEEYLTKFIASVEYSELHSVANGLEEYTCILTSKNGSTIYGHSGRIHKYVDKFERKEEIEDRAKNLAYANAMEKLEVALRFMYPIN